MYSLLAANLKVETSFDFHIIFDNMKNIIGETIDNDEIFDISFKSYIGICINVFNNIEDDKYSSRCFNDLIWITTIQGKNYLIDKVIEIINKYLNEKQLKTFINDFQSEKSQKLRFRNTSLYNFESLIVIDETLFNDIEVKLNHLLNDKIKEKGQV